MSDYEIDPTAVEQLIAMIRADRLRRRLEDLLMEAANFGMQVYELPRDRVPDDLASDAMNINPEIYAISSKLDRLRAELLERW